MSTARDDVQDPTGQRTNIPGRGFARGFGIGPQYAVTANTVNGVAGNPINGEVGWAPGALFQNVLSNVAGNILWLNIGTVASAVWINIDLAQGSALVSLTAALTLTALAHANRTLLLNGSAGFIVTLPAATGSGFKYYFIVQAPQTSYEISTDGTAVYNGWANINKVGSAGSGEVFATTTLKNLTMNATTTGGLSAGDYIEIQDIATNVWFVNAGLTGSGTLATPFS